MLRWSQIASIPNGETTACLLFNTAMSSAREAVEYVEEVKMQFTTVDFSLVLNVYSAVIVLIYEILVLFCNLRIYMDYARQVTIYFWYQPPSLISISHRYVTDLLSLLAH